VDPRRPADHPTALDRAEASGAGRTGADARTETDAPPPVFPAGATIAYVQIQAVIASSKIGKCGSAQMKVLRDKDQAALATKEKELQVQQQKIQAQQGLVSDAVMTGMQHEARAPATRGNDDAAGVLR